MGNGLPGEESQNFALLQKKMDDILTLLRGGSVSIVTTASPGTGWSVTGLALDASVTGLGTLLTTLNGLVSTATAQAALYTVTTGMAAKINDVDTLMAQVKTSCNNIDTHTAGVAAYSTQLSQVARLSNILSTAQLIEAHVASGATYSGQLEIMSQLAGVISQLQDQAPPTAMSGCLLTMILSNHEYSSTLPTACKAFEIQNRNMNNIMMSLTASEVADATKPYTLIKAGGDYCPPAQVKLTGQTVYLAGTVAGDVVVLKVWT
jgi:hypothetical protein